MTENKSLLCILTASLSLSLSGCAVVPKPLDHSGQDDGGYFVRTVEPTDAELAAHRRFTQYDVTSRSVLPPQRVVRGDLLQIHIDGMESMHGLYQVNVDGSLDLPFTRSLAAAGLSRTELTQRIESELVKNDWFYAETVRVNISVVRLASINVAVAGAVFNPGNVTINSAPRDKPAEEITHQAGAFSKERNLDSALRAAGGARPDADLSNVLLIRNENAIHIDISAAMNGQHLGSSPALLQGDQIFIPSTGVEDTTLIRPSELTPPGMRVFLSNLTAPALNNALSAIGADATRLPYGSSLLDSALAANCVGGTHHANASRSIVLITRNYGSRRQIVVRRTINQLLADSADYAVNPYLMPNDGIACYDSRFTNFRDVARGVGEVVGPFILGGLL